MTTKATAELVRQMREALTHNGGTGAERMARVRAIAAADQWLAQQRGPMTDEQIIAIAPPEIPERYDDDLVYFARAIERANGIGQPASNQENSNVPQPG